MKNNMLSYKQGKRKSNVKLWVSAYMDNGNIYVGLRDKDGSDYCDVTVNLDEKLKPYCGYVKNYSGQEDIEDFLLRNNIAELTGKYKETGFVVVPQYLFDPEKLREFDPDGLFEYEQTLKADNAMDFEIVKRIKQPILTKQSLLF